MHRSMSRLLMSYDNPILRYDIKAFVRDAFEASAAGVMVGARWYEKLVTRRTRQKMRVRSVRNWRAHFRLDDWGKKWQTRYLLLRRLRRAR